MALTDQDVAILLCPRCDGVLQRAGGVLRCARCAGVLEVREDVPDLLPWSGGAAGPEWDRWRSKLESLQEWRRATWDGSPASGDRQRVADDLASEFFRFARIPESGQVLEIGCGGGELSRYVPRRRYWGIDPIPLAVPSATPGCPAPVILRGVGEKIPIASGVFEAILLCETLDHALDPPRVLREARRVLKEGGVLAVMQSVQLEMPAPPARVRLRAAAGRVKARLLGAARSGGPPATATKMHFLTQDDLARLVGAEFLVESGITRGSTMFLRALRQDLASPRVPKRPV